MTPDQKRLLWSLVAFVLFLLSLIALLLARFVQGTATMRLKNEPRLSTRP